MPCPATHRTDQPKDSRARHPHDRAPNYSTVAGSFSYGGPTGSGYVDAPRFHRPESRSTRRRSRVTSRTVTPLPHQSAASRADRPSSWIIVSSA